MRQIPGVLLVVCLGLLSARAALGQSQRPGLAPPARAADPESASGSVGPRLAAGDPEPKKAKKGKHKAKAAAEDEEAKPPAKANSEHNRKGKTVVVAAELGLVDALNSGFGAEAGYFLGPDLLVEADYFASSFALLGFATKINLATARLKWFVGNSFYVQGGAGIRQLTSVNNFGNTLLGTDSLYSSTQSATSVIAEIGLGNRWQFTNFTIGCDWVGYAQPLAKLSSSESFGGPPNPDQQASDHANFQKESSSGNALLVRFHLGWAF